jgi:hypothetical protein
MNEMKVKKRVISPDWGKVADLHRQVNILFERWAKLWGLIWP